MADWKRVAEDFGRFLLQDQSKGQRKQGPDGWIRGRCPRASHEDREPSFGYNADGDGWQCSCGGGKGSELRAELGWRSLLEQAEQIKSAKGYATATALPPNRPPDDIYEYANGNRKLKYRNPNGTKTCVWEHQENGQWVTNKVGDPGLYNQNLLTLDLPFLFISESESDADSLMDIGLPCIACPYGSNTPPTKEQAAMFSGKTILIAEHQDEPGEKFTHKCTEILSLGGADIFVFKPKSPHKDVRDWILAGGTKDEITAAAQALITRNAPKNYFELIELAEAQAKLPLVTPGLKEFEPYIKGYRPGWFVVVAAFTSGGKSTYLTFYSLHLTLLGHPVLFISLEQSATEVIRQVSIAYGGAPENDGRLKNLFAWDESYSLGTVISTIERWANKHKGGLTPVVMIDYVQRLRPPKTTPNRERDVAVSVEELQRLGRRLGVLLIVAAQLNRLSQGESGPALHHLRESGTIEQAADVALLLSKLSQEQLQIIIAKNRYGRSGETIDLSVDFEHARFGPLSDNARYTPFGREIVEYLEDQPEKKAKMRELCRKVRFGSKRPRKTDVIEAAKILGSFKIENGIVFLVAAT